ncbi:MAG TPA: PLP-dependent aminotransferase family protein [Candidatus Acidoferrum sp.]|nr:PLP-dependent aminotransferase family protein [Candidatus Acidoferrum sp.]
MRDLLFHLQRDSRTPLQVQLREQLVSAILQGQLPVGSPLPSSRKLAETLDVARNTVAVAYQELVADGFLVAQERRGYFINGEILRGRAPAMTVARKQAATPDWARRLKLRPTSQRNIIKPSDWQSYRYPFIYGQIDPALFPLSEWRECSRQALSVEAVNDWAFDHYTEDDPLLVEQIRTRLLPRRGVRVAADEILVTVGAQHALYLLAALLIGRDSIVGIEDPGYADARNIFLLQTGGLRALGVDDHGLVIDGRLNGCDCVYVTPSHQFPTTAHLSLERRQALLRRADADDFIVIEDDYESEINHVGPPTPALKSLDGSDRVAFVASLSKTLAPGLRLGYMAGPAELIREARALRRLMLRHPPANNQRTVALFLALGHHDALMRRLSQAFRERWRVMRDALSRHLPQCKAWSSVGGTAYWIEGPPQLDARETERRAARAGVVIEPGDIHFLGPDPPRHAFRLGFSSIPTERIEPGLQKLGETIAAQLREAGAAPGRSPSAVV